MELQQVFILFSEVWDGGNRRTDTKLPGSKYKIDMLYVKTFVYKLVMCLSTNGKRA